MRHAMILLILGTLLVSPIQWAGGQSAPASDPAEAVFQLVTYDRDPDPDGLAESHGRGTGFFIKPDGTALTVSHLVYAAVHYPRKYRLLAVVGKEFYDVQVACASSLPDPMQARAPASRDVAEVKIIPSNAFDGRKHELFFVPKNGDRFVWATAHTDAVPQFPYLTIGRAPQVYAHVRVVGFGHIGPIPERWTSEGRVDQTWDARDKTPLFDVESTNPAQPGDSGAPVINDQGEVVGLWAWHNPRRPTVGTAQVVSAIVPACR